MKTLIFVYKSWYWIILYQSSETMCFTTVFCK